MYTNILPVSSPELTREQNIAQYAYHAMLTEVGLTPKPGLVDRDNTGAHKDMDLDTFSTSADSIFPFLEDFILLGKESCHEIPKKSFIALKKLGFKCECHMFAATRGINTHKGMIFASALILGAIGRLIGRKEAVSAPNIQQQIKKLSAGLVNNDLKQMSQDPDKLTAGEKLYVKYGVTGARGEAESGYETLFVHALPTYRKFKTLIDDDESALLMTLVYLMSVNEDTNLLSRGGLPALTYVQDKAKELYAEFSRLFEPQKPKQNLLATKNLKFALKEFDRTLIRAHLSPGGSADLLAMTWFLDKILED